MPYVVMVADNFHHGEGACPAGTFVEASAALACCRSIVDEYLESACTAGMSAAQLWDSYTSFGDDPYLVCVDAPELRFSAWDYARIRCAELERPALSPMERLAKSVRAAILGAWLHDAIESYRDATVLLGLEADLGRITLAQTSAPDTSLLTRCYDALARRFSAEVTDGRQLDLFEVDADAALQERWSRFAVGCMNRRQSGQRARWILQATVGLDGPIDRATAADFLAWHVLDAPLPNA